MNISQGSLVIVGANTPERKVFWKGVEVECVGITIDSDSNKQRVVIEVAENQTYAEMQSAGITIKRVIL